MDNRYRDRVHLSEEFCDLVVESIRFLAINAFVLSVVLRIVHGKWAFTCANRFFLERNTALAKIFLFWVLFFPPFFWNRKSVQEKKECLLTSKDVATSESEFRDMSACVLVDVTATNSKLKLNSNLMTVMV